MNVGLCWKCISHTHTYTQTQRHFYMYYRNRWGAYEIRKLPNHPKDWAKTLHACFEANQTEQTNTQCTIQEKYSTRTRTHSPQIYWRTQSDTHWKLDKIYVCYYTKSASIQKYRVEENINAKKAKRMTEPIIKHKYINFCVVSKAHVRIYDICTGNQYFTLPKDIPYEFV